MKMTDLLGGVLGNSGGLLERHYCLNVALGGFGHQNLLLQAVCILQEENRIVECCYDLQLSLSIRYVYAILMLCCSDSLF